MSADDVHDEDALAARLRAGLDRELQDVRSRPGDLDAVLHHARSASRGGAAPWVLSAAAVALVALAVPVGVQVLRDDPPADRLAAPAPAPATLPAPSTLLVPPSPASPDATPPGSSGRPSPVLTPPPLAPSATTPPTRTAPPVRTSPSTCRDEAPAGPTGPVQADLEGDGRPDGLAFADGALVTRFSRGGSSTTPFLTASPYASVLVVEADGVAADDELLVLTRGAIGNEGDVAVNATLYDLTGCALAPVANAQGRPYVFEVGASRAGTVRSGVECDGDVLLGVVGVEEAGRWQVTRTPVGVRDGVAVNGEPRRSVLTADDPAVARLSEATCGDAPVQSLG